MVQRLLIRGPMPVESIGPLVDLPPQMGRPGAGERGWHTLGCCLMGCGHQAGHHKLVCLCLPAAATLVRFVERRPHLFRLRRFPNSPVALVAVAPGAQAWLAYKRRLLQVGSEARS